MFDSALSLIQNARTITVVQAENPDGDSLGSALALEEILGDAGKTVTLYCPVDIPKYLRYVKGWDRVTNEFDTHANLVIIVDTAADVLLSKVLQTPGVRHFLETHPVLVIDHHTTESNLTFDHTLVTEDAIASSVVIYHLATAAGWTINAQAAENMLIALMSDSLGLTTQSVTAESFEIAGALTRLGASNAEIESQRREFMKKSPKILAYKGTLIGRIEYYLPDESDADAHALALVHIPFEDIQAYSDQYNPSVLVLDEMRLVEGVQVGVAIKTYPDGKITGKLRTNLPVAEHIAGFFGGGGHEYAAGFRVYDTYDTVVRELIDATAKALREYHAA